jgi:hypothetical protein
MVSNFVIDRKTMLETKSVPSVSDCQKTKNRIAGGWNLLLPQTVVSACYVAPSKTCITICLIKRKEKSCFFLSDMKFCFLKQLASALEETMYVARSESSQKKSAVVAGRVLNFGTKEGTTSFEPIERPITCVSVLYDARQAS